MGLLVSDEVTHVHILAFHFRAMLHPDHLQVAMDVHTTLSELIYRYVATAATSGARLGGGSKMSSFLSELPDSGDSSAFEQQILQVKEVFVYKIPPLRSASGHRAEDWDLANPVLTGLLRVLQNDVKLYVRIYSYNDPKSLAASPENLTLFGECPIEVQPKGDIIAFVDGVIDSSRYYVVRMQDRASSRTTMVGIGFRDREVAFDFKNALNEYVRYVDRMARAAGGGGPADKDKNTFTFGDAGSPDEDDQQVDDVSIARPLRDLSIKEGEKIKINIGGIAAPKRASSSSGPSPSFGLPPPPSAGSVIKTTPSQPHDNNNALNKNDNNAVDDDEFGDFEGFS